MRTRTVFAGERGMALLEVLIGAVVAGIAIVGLSLMFSLGQTAVLAEGDERVGLYLAQQKVEKLRAVSFSATPLNSAGNTNGGCAASSEPCYNETIAAGSGGTQSFTRVTCVNYVSDDDASSPNDCTDCIFGGTCTQRTKRIRVDVTSIKQAAGVRIEALMACPPGQTC